MFEVQANFATPQEYTTSLMILLAHLWMINFRYIYIAVTEGLPQRTLKWVGYCLNTVFPSSSGRPHIQDFIHVLRQNFLCSVLNIVHHSYMGYICIN